MRKIIVLLMFYVLLVSCASLSTQDEKVLVTSNLERIEGCDFMGQVESSSNLIDLTANGVAYDHARNELMNESRQLGANVVIMSSNSDTMGEAYRCKSATF
jgi:hypothetical protein